jgi:tetratricopeptide (TPR) repeat protein
MNNMLAYLKETSCLIVLIIFIAIGCTPTENHIEYVDGSEQDSIQIADLLRKWRIAYYQSPDSIRVVADELIKYSTEKKNKQGLVSGNNILAMYHSKIGNDEKALEIYYENLKTNQGDQAGLAKIYNNIGNCYLRRGDYGLALEAQINGLKAEEELGNTEGIATSYLNIAGIYAHMKEFSDATVYGKKSYRLAEDHGLDIVKMQVSFQLAEILAKQFQDSIALVYADTTIACATRLNSSFGINKAKTIKSNVFISQNRIEEALSTNKEIGDYYKLNNLHSEYLNCKITEAELLIRLGKYNASEVISLDNVSTAIRLQEKEQIARSYHTLSSAQDRLHKINSA